MNRKEIENIINDLLGKITIIEDKHIKRYYDIKNNYTELLNKYHALLDYLNLETTVCPPTGVTYKVTKKVKQNESK